MPTFSKSDWQAIKQYQDRYQNNMLLWICELFNSAESTKEYYNYLSQIEKILNGRDFSKKMLPESLCKEYKAFHKKHNFPDPLQIRFLNTLNNNMCSAVKSGKGTGKTTTLAWYSLYFTSMALESQVYVMSAKHTQTILGFLKEAKKWIGKSEFLKHFYEIKTESICANDDMLKSQNFIQPVSARDLEGVQGLHANRIAFLIDEASVLSEDFEVVAQGILTTADEEHGSTAKIILSGNPLRLTGAFYNAFHKEDTPYANVTLDGEESFNVADKFVKFVLKKTHRNSNLFRTQVKGQFPIEDNDVIIPFSLAQKGVDNKILSLNHNITIGIDYGMISDSTAIAVTQDRKLIDLRQYYGLNESEILSTTIDTIRQYNKNPKNNITVRPDATGIGLVLTQRLLREIQKEKLSVVLDDVNFSRKAFENEVYMDTATEMYFFLRDLLRCELVDFGSDIVDERLLHIAIEQLTSRKKEEDKRTLRTRLEGKKDYRKRLGYSPDLSDALVLAFYNYTDLSEFAIKSKRVYKTDKEKVESKNPASFRDLPKARQREHKGLSSIRKLSRRF